MRFEINYSIQIYDLQIFSYAMKTPMCWILFTFKEQDEVVDIMNKINEWFIYYYLALNNTEEESLRRSVPQIKLIKWLVEYRNTKYG